MAKTPRNTGTQDTGVADDTELTGANEQGVDVVSTEGSIRKVVLASLFLNRPTGKLDKDKNPMVTRHQPVIGSVFEFTNQEIKDIMASNPAAIRDPVNEDDATALDRTPVAVAIVATDLAPAPGDAAQVQRSAERGTHKLPGTEGSIQSEAAKPAEDEEL